MIGIGKWQITLNTNILSRTAVVEIKDCDGNYDVSVISPGFTVPPYKLLKVETVDENTLVGHFEITDLPAKYVTVRAVFTEDTISGFIKIPLIGRLEFTDGKKIG